MDALVLLASSDAPSLLETVQGYAWMILSVAAGLGFVIFVHELGHFLVAKACGVKCEKFYIGFDIFNLRFCRFQWGETEYGIGALPLGGYVKMLGQDDDPRHAMEEAERCKVPAADSSDAARAAALAEGTSAEGLTPGATVEQPQPEPKYELDPRSYPAKPVLARMAIISAGVIMNVIFGVFLAAGAYWLGVPEKPASIGITIPGTTAWTNNLEPGTKVIAFGEDGKRYEHYRFEDVKLKIIFNGDNRDLPLLVRDSGGQERTVRLLPESRTGADFPTIGFLLPHVPKLSIAEELPKHLRPKTDRPLRDKDRVVSINGVDLKAEGYDPKLDALLAQNASSPLTLRIERPSVGDKESAKSEMLNVIVQPRPLRDVGIEMKLGPVVAVRVGSPAEKAGFQAGDVIKQIDGKPVGNPLLLSQRLIPPVEGGVTYTFLVERKGADGRIDERQLTVVPELPRQYQPLELGGPVAIESIGVACEVTREVAAVAPRSAAEREGLRPGDRVVSVTFIPADDKAAKEERKILGEENQQEIVLDDDAKNWAYAQMLMQGLLPETKVRLTLQRGGKTVQAVLKPTDSRELFDARHGLRFYELQVTHQAESIAEAFYLGGREVKERMVEVVATISQLFKKPAFAKHLSGPAGIIYAAGRFAGEGLPTLLIFLTILSANLAVLNFLPIPVLDGGHLLFLAWEGITRKPVNPNVQGYLSLAGLVLLLSLMIFATAMDFNRFFS